MTSSIPSSTVNVSTLTPIVDAALTEVTGSVIGGGAPGATGPTTQIPAFVQQYLDGDTAKLPSATGGYVEQHQRDNEAPTKKGGANTGPTQSREGQATTGFPPYKGHSAPRTAPPNTNGSVPPDADQRASDCVPRRYRHLPFQLPPTKGGATPPPAPPMKDAPPITGEPPMKTPPPMKGEPPMKTPPTKAPPTKGSGSTVPVQDAPVATRTYTVVGGDNLSQIAEKFDISWRQLYWANKDQVQNPDLIYPGQKLTLPANDLQVPDFEYEPTFTPGIRSETAGTGTVTTSTPPSKAPDAPVKSDPAPPKDPKTTPTPDSPDAPPSPTSGSGQAPPAPGTSGNGLPPALPS